jgi:ankyrin repeat protein
MPVSETLINHMTATKRDDSLVPMYFSFDSTSIRFNSVKAWLRTTLSSAIQSNFVSRSYVAKEIAALLHDLHAWDTDDLYSHFEQYLVYLGTASYYVFILANFGECDDSSLAFLDRLRFRLSKTEIRFRFIITTSTGPNTNHRLLESLSRTASNIYQQVQLGSSRVAGSEVSSFAEFDLSMLLHRHPQYTDDYLGKQIKHLLTVQYKDQPALLSRIYDWLDASGHGTQDSRVREGIASLATAETTEEAVYRVILNSIPQQQHIWAQTVLTWILTCVRPLKFREFCFLSDWASAMTHKEDGQSQPNPGIRLRRYRLSDATRMLAPFGGLVGEVKGEIRFCDGSFRQWLLLKQVDHEASPVDETKPTDGNHWYARLGPELLRHFQIVRLCLEFLDTAKTEEPLDALAYATRYWPTHYKIARSVDKATTASSLHADILASFESKPVWSAWWQAYSKLANPLEPTDGIDTRLQIAAHLGLEDFVEDFKDGTMPTDPSYRRALVGAAERGHVETLRLLLPPNRDKFDVGLRDVSVQEYAKAAARGGGEVLREMMARIPKENLGDMENREFLVNILSRAAWDGLGDVIKLIGDPGPYIPDGSKCSVLPNSTPLSLAVRRHNMDAFRALLEIGAQADAQCCDHEGWDGMPMQVACDMGIDDAAAALLEKEPENTGYSEWPYISCATDWGHHAVAKVLADHSPSRDFINTGSDTDPVILAAEHGYLQCFEAVFVPGIDVNLTASRGTLLFYAACGKNLEICRILLSKDADPNRSVKDGMTPLGRAVFDNSLEIAEFFLDHGAEVDKPSGSLGEIAGACSPLHIATNEQHKEMVALLLRRKAEPNSLDAEGWSVLCTASRLGDVDLIDQLVAAGAEVNKACTATEKTAVHMAVKHPEAMRALLKHGADPRRRTNAGSTPLDLAVLENTEATTVKILLEESPENNRKPDFTAASFRSALASAVLSGKHDMATILLEGGADVNQECDHLEGLTLLSLAVRSGHVETVRTVLEFRPELHTANADGDTALHFVGRETSVEIVRLLINAGCTLDAMSNKGNTPLSNAVKVGNLAVVKYMLTKSPAISTLNLVRGYNSIPLHQACLNANPDIVSILLAKGANPNLCSTGAFGGTPLVCACFHKIFNSSSSTADSSTIIHRLISNNAIPALPAGPFGFALNAAALASVPEILRLFLEKGADINGTDPLGRRPVHMACYNSLQALQALHLPGTHFSLRDNLGRLPLHYAALSGQEDLLAEVLSRSLQAGLSVDEKDNDRWTPLLWAARAVQVYCHEDRAAAGVAMVKKLLSKGADVKVRGEGLYENQNWSAREIALYHGVDDVAELLAASGDVPGRDGPRTRRIRKRGDITGGYCDVCLLVSFIPSHILLVLVLITR